MRKKRSDLSKWLSGDSAKSPRNGYGEGKRGKRDQREREPRRGGYRS